MGICYIEDKNCNINNMLKINIDKKREIDLKNDDMNKNEAVFPGIGNSISNGKLAIISNQKQKTICKIINNNKKGTGFLCYISGKNNKKVKTLITAYHVLGENDLKIGKEIKITFNEDNKK